MKNNTVTHLSAVSMSPKNEDAHATYPQVVSANLSADLVAASQSESLQLEALNKLRSQLMIRWFNQENQVLAIVGALPGDGCSYISANLATLFAQLGKRTLLIDANLRTPRQHQIFNLKPVAGLTELLMGEADLTAITQVDSIEGLSLLCAVKVPKNALSLLSHNAFSHLMNQVKEQYDIVIVDTSPAKASADAQTVVAHCDGVLLVSKLNHTKLSDLSELRDQMSITGAQIVGGVINQF